MIESLFSMGGKVSRKQFAVSGVILFAIKYNLDRFIAINFQRNWFITDYFKQADHLSVNDLTPADQKFYLLLVITSLPFIWMGTVLCLKRLRDIPLPSWLVAFFFIPLVNILFFILLCILPAGQTETGKDEKPSFLKNIIPKSETGSILFSIGITVVVALLMVVFSVNEMNEYGWGLFIAIPFFIGFVSVLLYSYHHQPVSMRKAIGISISAVSIFAVFLFGLAMEGVICILMAAPFGYVLGSFGAILAYTIQHQPSRASLNSIAAYILIVPLIMWFESRHEETEVYELKTSIVINQPPAIVWNQLVNFSKIDPPKEFIFKTGIAYPNDAEITGRGVGAIRKCNFTTGSFVEPITIWDEPHLLKFDVLQQPPPMFEMSVYDHVKAPHLEGYFTSEKGQFKLEQLNDHQTLLEGTTWYRNKMWPSVYWKQWSDFILHKIHSRVLNHIKTKAEEDQNHSVL